MFNHVECQCHHSACQHILWQCSKTARCHFWVCWKPNDYKHPATLIFCQVCFSTCSIAHLPVWLLLVWSTLLTPLTLMLQYFINTSAYCARIILVVWPLSCGSWSLYVISIATNEVIITYCTWLVLALGSWCKGRNNAPCISSPMIEEETIRQGDQLGSFIHCFDTVSQVGWQEEYPACENLYNLSP